MARLQESILSIITAFHTHARRDGDRGTLSKEELGQLIQQELADVIANPQSLETTEKVLCSLDDDCDNRVDFGEFLALVFHMAKACYKELRQGQALGKGQELMVHEEAGREDAAHSVSHHQQTQDNQDQGAETPEMPQTQQAPDEEPEALQAERTEVPEQNPKRREILALETAEQNRNTHPDEESGAPKQDPDTQGTERPEEGPNNHQARDVDTQENASSNLQAPEMESAEHGLNCPPETPAREASNEMQMCKAPQQDPSPSETCKLQQPEQDESPRKGAKTQEPRQDPPLHHEPEAQELSDAEL